jgi:large subunit ribosomal protein L1
MSFIYLLRNFASKKGKGPFYTPEEALRLLREGIEKPPNEAFGLTVKLGVDPTKGEQNVRGNVFLPAGTGKKNKIAVFIPEEHKDLAYKLGATIAGSELMNNVKEGKIDFEQVLATEEMIDELKPFGRVLGQRGLMPTLRNKTVVPFSDFEQEMNKLTKGTVSYKITKAAIIHGTLGKASLTDAEVLANLRAFMTSIIEEKPNHFKKTYLKKVFMTSTFTKSYELDIQLVDINHYRCVLSNYKLS